MPDAKMPDPGNPDWKELVRERMGALGLPRDIQENVVNELAAHLQETYEAARSERIKEEEGVELALQEVNDWNVLAAKIQRAKSEEEIMNHRTKSLWLPGLLTFLGASASLMLIQFAGLQPRLEWIAHTGVTVYWHWLASLPFFGALGAYLSQRSRGSTWARLGAGLSPALVMLIVMCILLPWGLAIDGFAFFRLVMFGVCLTNWVLFPALALTLGAIPFLREPNIPAAQAQG
jgi:hypothetical protein